MENQVYALKIEVKIYYLQYSHQTNERSFKSGEPQQIFIEQKGGQF